MRLDKMIGTIGGSVLTTLVGDRRTGFVLGEKRIEFFQSLSGIANM